MQEPLDEEKVDKAVGFILHPSVRGSADDAKRSFLSKKGLTKEEIDEAFRRAAEGSNTSAGAVPSSSMNSSTAAQMKVNDATVPAAVHVPGYSYTNVLLGVGFAAAAVYSIKTIFGPSISKKVNTFRTSISRRLSSRQGNTDLEGETNAFSGEGTSPEDDARGVTIVELDDIGDADVKTRCKLDADGGVQLVEAIRDLREEVRHLGERLDALAMQGAHRTGEFPKGHVDNLSGTEEPIKDGDNAPMSYMQVLEMLEQGRPIPGIRDDINDKPPNPDLSPTASTMQWRAKPWDIASKDAESIENVDNLKEDPEYSEDGAGSSGTPGRVPSRDISGNRPSNSIYESVTKTPDTNSRSPWRPPPLPSPSISR